MTTTGACMVGSLGQMGRWAVRQLEQFGQSCNNKLSKIEAVER
jgi:hypothetical protein